VTTWGRLSGDRGNTLFASLVFLFTLAVYTITLTPNVPFWDGGEFIATSFILGIPHAPGTPLYVLIGRVFSLLPLGNVAERVNWISALSSALSLLFLYLITVKISRKVFPWEDHPVHRWIAYLAGVVAALIAGFATTFWDNAIEAEVYASSCFLMAFVVWLALRWEERLDEGSEDGLLLVITYLVGLGIAIHLGVALAAWAAVIFVFLCRPAYLTRWNYLGWGVVTLSLATGIHRAAFAVAPAILILTLGVWLLTGKFRKLAFWASILFMAGVSVHLYLIIRANLDPIINEAAPKTWDALWKMLIRDQYKPPPIWDRKASWGYQLDFMWLRYMWWNFSTWGGQVGENYVFRDFLRGILQPAILLSVVGTVVHFVRARRTAVLLGVLFVLLGPAMAVYLNFRVGEVRERDYFFVQNFMFMAIWTGLGAAWFVNWAREQFSGPVGRKGALAAACAGVLVVALVPVKENWHSHDRRGFMVANNYAYNMLVDLEPNAIVFTNGDNDTFPLWYLQEVEGVRKDVRVVNLSLLNTDWYIKQLRDLKPKVPITWTDDQIANVRPYRDKDGRIWLIKDIATYHILKANDWKRPVYLAVTVPDQMGLTDQLTMEGLVFKIHPTAVSERVNVEKTLHALDHDYKYQGLIRTDADGNWLGHDNSVYKDENASRLSQNYAAAYARCALELMDQNKAEQALKEIERAQMIAPDFPGMVLAKGVILEQLGRYDEAVAHYRKMLDRFPNDWQLYYRLGESLVQQGKTSEAIPYYEQAIQIAPANQFYPYQGLASAYYQLNRYEAAAKVLQQWLVLHPDDQNVKPFYDQLMQSLRTGTPIPGADSAASDSEPALPDGN